MRSLNLSSIFPGSVLQWVILGCLSMAAGIGAIITAELPSQWIKLVFLTLLFLFVVMLYGNVRKSLLTLIIFDIPFQADFNLYYHHELASLGTEGGLTISVTLVCLTALYALWLSELLSKSAPSPRCWFRLSLPLVVYLAFVIISVAAARNIFLSLFEIFLLLQTFLLWVYIVATTRTRQDVLFIVTVLLISLVLESLVMIAVGVAGRSFDLGVVTAEFDHGRVGGTLGSPIIAAGVLYLLLAPALSILVTQVRKYYKWLAALAFGLGGLALLLTFSRGGWFVFFLSCGSLSLLVWHRGWLSPSLPFAFSAVVILLVVFFQDAILNRMFGDDGGSAIGRFPLNQLAINMIRDNPLGVGANNFAVRLKEYVTFDTAWSWHYTVHNKYLLVWAETGLGALGAFIWFLLATLRRGWQCWKFKDRFLSPLALAFTLAIIGNMLHMNVDVFHSRGVVVLLWLIAGLITAMYSMAREERSTAFEESL